MSLDDSLMSQAKHAEWHAAFPCPTLRCPDAHKHVVKGPSGRQHVVSHRPRLLCHAV